MFGNTITALATVPMNGAIHIIRVSGIDTYKILSTITKKKIKKAGYSIERAMIYDQQTVIDDVLLMKFVSPKSFTGEDLIEINCHGGLFIANKIISLLIKNGVSLAKNGEFTKLAFMNKKLNLNQANAINNLIKSTSEKGIEFAHNGLNTETNKKLEELCDILFRLIGQIEVNIDYPEYDDIQKYIKEDVIGRLEAINEMIKLIVSNSKDMIKHVEGYNIAIIGKPNAGKSSLLNALLNEDKAIVSNISGTTRDIVEGKINIKGLNFNILDTAGIKEHTSSKLEKIGIKKTIDSLDKADIIIWVIDGSKKQDENDEKIFQLIKKKKYIIVNNKSDVKTKHLWHKYSGLPISAKNKNIEPLLNTIFSMIKDFSIDKNIPSLQTSSIISSVEKVCNLIDKSVRYINNDVSIDLVLNYLHDAHNNLLKVLGKDSDYEFIDEMFKNFCLGK